MRLFLDQWKTDPRPPTLENVKAHDEGMAGAKKATLRLWAMNRKMYWQSRPLMARMPNTSHRRGTQTLCRSTMRRIIDITHAVSQGWWEQHRTTGAARRTWLSQLYLDGVEID